MQCPIDGSTLIMSDRQGIEIDYCPQCRGVWLDRGEIDKIVERSGAAVNTPPGQQSQYPQTEQFQQHRESRDHDGDDTYRPDKHHDNKQRKRKESWLGELFE